MFVLIQSTVPKYFDFSKYWCSHVWNYCWSLNETVARLSQVQSAARKISQGTVHSKYCYVLRGVREVAIWLIRDQLVGKFVWFQGKCIQVAYLHRFPIRWLQKGEEVNMKIICSLFMSICFIHGDDYISTSLFKGKFVHDFVYFVIIKDKINTRMKQ